MENVITLKQLILILSNDTNQFQIFDICEKDFVDITHEELLKLNIQELGLVRIKPITKINSVFTYQNWIPLINDSLVPQHLKKVEFLTLHAAYVNSDSEKKYGFFDSDKKKFIDEIRNKEYPINRVVYWAYSHKPKVLH